MWPIRTDSSEIEKSIKLGSQLRIWTTTSFPKYSASKGYKIRKATIKPRLPFLGLAVYRGIAKGFVVYLL